MASELWIVNTPVPIKVTYTPRRDQYPISERHQLSMPDDFDPQAPNHVHVLSPPVTSLLHGFSIHYGSDDKHPADHWVRELQIEVTGGWTDVEGPGSLRSGPYLDISVGLRDNSGGDPPDDPFVAVLLASALVVFSG
jgi:hypothetical protein